jgi:hypothetical protein
MTPSDSQISTAGIAAVVETLKHALRASALGWNIGLVVSDIATRRTDGVTLAITDTRNAVSQSQIAGRQKVARLRGCDPNANPATPYIRDRAARCDEVLIAA